MHAEKWAPAAAAVVALCLLEVGPALAVVSALGLDVLLAEVILLPLLAAFLGLTLWALASDRTYHRDRGPTRLGWAAAALLLPGAWLFAPVAWLGLVLLAAAAAWNLVLLGRLSERRRRARETGRKV